MLMKKELYQQARRIILLLKKKQLSDDLRMRVCGLSGDLFRVKSQWALAIKEYRIAQEIVLNTQSLDLLPRIHSGLAVCYIRIKRFAGALCVLEEILQTQALSSALDQTYYLKGIVLFKTGDFGAAQHAFRRALEC